MIEWVLDTHYAALHRARGPRETSVIVFGAMEATLTPLMEAIEAAFDGIKVFSLPSVDHPEWGRHIELGVKGVRDAARGRLRGAARRVCASTAPSSAPKWCAERSRRVPCQCMRTRMAHARPRQSARWPRARSHGAAWHAFCYISVRISGPAAGRPIAHSSPTP